MSDILDKFADTIYKCIRCGACRAVCPTFGEELSETSVARGRMALAEAVLSGKIGLTPTYEKAIFHCALCGACRANCPSGVDVPAVIEAARAELVKQKGSEQMFRYLARRSLADKAATDKAFSMMSLGGALYGPVAATPLGRYLPYQYRDLKRKLPRIPSKTLAKRIPAESNVPHPKGRVALYAGCVAYYVYPEVGEAAVRVLNAAGYDVIFLKDEVCCGKPLKSLGETKEFIKLAEKNIGLFKGLDVAAVLTVCPTCALTLREDYPKILPESTSATALAARVDDIGRFLLRRSDILGLIEPSALSVTYHDPCHLNWGMGIRTEPRELLRKAAGKGLVEMSEPDWCCGFGGSFSFLNYMLSGSISAKKAANVLDTGADELATGCPGCMMHIQDALRQTGSGIRAVHTIQVIDRALV